MEKLVAICRNAALVITFSALLFGGCVPVPLYSEPPANLVEKSTLDSLIGRRKESVLSILGHPDVELSGEKASYFVYGGRGDEHQLLLMIYVPVAGQKVPGGKLYCVLLEFDEHQILRQHRLKKHSGVWSGKSGVLDCPASFFDADTLKEFAIRSWAEPTSSSRAERRQLERRLKEGDGSYEFKVELARRGFSDPLAELAWSGNLEAATDLYEFTGIWGPLKRLADEGDYSASSKLVGDFLHDRLNAMEAYRRIFEQAKLGDSDAQLKLFYDRNTRNRLHWLCRAADGNNPEARSRLAWRYEHGADEVPQSNTKAIVWYRLAAKSGSAWGSANAERLAESATEKELHHSITLLDEWQPGWCMRDLALDWNE